MSAEKTLTIVDPDDLFGQWFSSAGGPGGTSTRLRGRVAIAYVNQLRDPSQLERMEAARPDHIHTLGVPGTNVTFSYLVDLEHRIAQLVAVAPMPMFCVEY